MVRGDFPNFQGPHLPTFSHILQRVIPQQQHLGQGDKWQMYIPSELGYGDGGTGVLLGMSSGETCSDIPGSQLEQEMEQCSKPLVG